MVDGPPRARMKTVTATASSEHGTVRVLVIDDHPALRAGLEGLLSNEPRLQYVGALTGTDGLLASWATCA